MKKNLIVIALALIIALPVFGLAQETTAPAEESQTTGTMPYGGQYGRRWNQTPPQGADDQTALSPYGMGSGRMNRESGQAARQNGFVDENGDGVCDICGNEQGKNTEAPGFTDENNDGVCDHLGTDQQRQGRGRMRPMRGGCGMRNRMPVQENFGGGRNRR